MELGCKAACTGAGTVNMRVGLGLTFYYIEVIKKNHIGKFKLSGVAVIIFII